MLTCPLCAGSADRYAQDRARAYFHCSNCDLVFADPDSHLNAAAEKQVYDQHENRPDDPRYRAFLSRLADPLLTRIHPGMHGLDYGSGPGPTLSVMLTESGMKMAIYDPYYAPDTRPLACPYDFVTCTEVVEHFRSPAVDWARLVSQVKPGGWLGVMTKLVIDCERFQTWHYKNDPTHVSFYSEATFRWLGAHFGFTVERVASDVILMRRHWNPKQAHEKSGDRNRPPL